MNLIGLDIGTTSICGVLYSKDYNKTLKVSARNNEFISSKVGEYQQNPDLIYEKIKSILDELISISSDRIEGLSLSSQMHGILYVNKDGIAVSPFYTWQNQRGLAKVGDVTLEEYLSNKLNYPVYSGYGITTHYSLFIENKIPLAAEYFCSIGDYVCMRLANRKIPITDITLAHSMGICDIESGKKALSLDSLGKECIKFIPKISEKIEILGTYKSIKVVQPIGDNQASFLGSVREKEKSLLLNYGTAGQISFFNNKYMNYRGFETRPLGNNEGYIHAAFSLCGGNSYKILARFYEDVFHLFSPDINTNAMKYMDKMELDFSQENIKCMPFFLGQRGKNNGNAYFSNITEANFTPQNMVASLIQGMVNELYDYYVELPLEVKNRISIIIGSGNGIRKNKHLIKAVENTYKKPLSLYNFSEESCLGAIIHAAKALGIYKDYNQGALEIINYN